MSTQDEQDPQTAQAEGRKIGFAALSPEQRQAIAARGGRAAHAKGVRHSWTAAEAAAAGRKGGQVPKRPRAPQA